MGVFFLLYREVCKHHGNKKALLPKMFIKTFSAVRLSFYKNRLSHLNCFNGLARPYYFASPDHSGFAFIVLFLFLTYRLYFFVLTPVYPIIGMRLFPFTLNDKSLIHKP